MSWEPQDESWNEMFRELVRFKEEHGHGRVPVDSAQYVDLVRWSGKQRYRRSISRLSKDRIVLLDSIGFVWNKRDASWQEQFDALVRFKKENGHTDVPTRHKELGGWLHAQRDQYRRGTLPSDREKLLSALDVAWKLRRGGDEAWKANFAELKRFRKTHGHCDVPMVHPPNPAFGRWLNKQRQRMRQSLLPPDRVRALKRLGVETNVVDAQWERRYRALVAFKAKHGHCNVPAKYPADRRLGQWLSRQRYARHQGQLSTDRIQRLSKLGVVWALKPGPTKNRELMAKRKHHRTGSPA
jgi:hypothetical protein